MNIADMLINTFIAESALLRVIKLADNSSYAALQADITRTFLSAAANKINNAAIETLSRFAEGDELAMMLAGVKRFTKVAPFNAIAARRRIADKMIEEKNYCF
jgi:hypothetical protein